jgi:hypothetical protein
MLMQASAAHVPPPRDHRLVIISDLLGVVVTVEVLAAAALLDGWSGWSWWPTGGAATTSC